MELDNLLSNVVALSPSFMESWGFSFSLMYKTGCRHEEINPKYWSEIDSNRILLESVKHSEQREFLKSDLGSELVAIMLTGDTSRLVLSRSTLTRAFMRVSYPWRLMSFGDNVFLHSFRYNYAKKQYALLHDVDAVQLKMGHKEKQNTLIYINKNIEILHL